MELHNNGRGRGCDSFVTIKLNNQDVTEAYLSAWFDVGLDVGLSSKPIPFGASRKYTWLKNVDPSFHTNTE